MAVKRRRDDKMRCEFLLILFCLVSPLKVLKRLRNGGRRRRRKEGGCSLGWRERGREREWL